MHYFFRTIKKNEISAERKKMLTNTPESLERLYSATPITSKLVPIIPDSLKDNDYNDISVTSLLYSFLLY